MMTEISAQVTPKTSVMHHYAAAQRAMSAFAQDTELTKRKIIEFANIKQVPEVAVGLSILSGVSVEHLDHLFRAGNGFGLMVLCRSLALDWQTTYVVIMASRTAKQLEESDTDDLREQYAALTIPSAQRVLRFWQGRQTVTKRVFQAAPG